MIRKTLIAAALLAGTAALTAPAQAVLSANSPVLQGVNLNGMRMNGLELNGPVLNGPVLNGRVLNGPVLNGPVAEATQPAAISIVLPSGERVGTR